VGDRSGLIQLAARTGWECREPVVLADRSSHRYARFVSMRTGRPSHGFDRSQDTYDKTQPLVWLGSYIQTVVPCVWPRPPSQPLGDPSGKWAWCATSLREAMIVVYDGHGERGPEGHVVTFVRPGVQEMRREPLGVAEKTMLWLERGVGRDLGSSDVELDLAVEAVGGRRREDGRSVGAGPIRRWLWPSTWWAWRRRQYQWRTTRCGHRS
jgi:hypothetical protein